MRHLSVIGFALLMSTTAFGAHPCKEAVRTQSNEALESCFAAKRSVYQYGSCIRFFFRSDFYQVCRDENAALKIGTLDTATCFGREITNPRHPSDDKNGPIGGRDFRATSVPADEVSYPKVCAAFGDRGMSDVRCETETRNFNIGNCPGWF